MVILDEAIAIRLGSYPIALGLPILVCGTIVFGAFVGLVLIALRNNENVHAWLRLRPWSITFSIDARNGVGNAEKPNSAASKDRTTASKP